MPDVYAAIDAASEEMQSRLADILELRAADPQQRAMLADYLRKIPLPPSARVIEIGCGTGAVARTLSQWPGVAEVVGVDPSPVFIERARTLAAAIPNLRFMQGDGRQLDMPPESCDLVVLHTVLCHVPEPEWVIADAHRVLRAGGWLAVFDGDYATTTVATGQTDPLQCCAEAAIAALVNDPWLVRRLPRLVAAAGFAQPRFASHGYAQTTDPDYLLTLIDRGADVLVGAGRIGPGLADALKAEARRRAEVSAFFGHIAYASVIARKPQLV
jgi:ubiquinone/menaquinone biosynthesis C-methylase UbiE